MARALLLARRGLYTTTPNPRVGCVLVRNGAVIGEGWHERAGGPHAEINALSEIVGSGGTASGATAYVTLEPCSHHGRTPPCADALITAGVARVVAAMRDPNPQVAGQGLSRLEVAGIAVESGLMADEAREINIGFVSRMMRGRPWLRIKVAASLDGKTALNNGASQWITGPEARRDVHAWRARSCAVLTGYGTVKEDDPQLTVRDVQTSRQPFRIVVDSKLRVSPSARICEGGGLLVATAVDDETRAAPLRERGVEVLALPGADGKVDLAALLEALARRGVNEVHVEAGHRLNGALLAEGLVDELVIYFAPTLLGDRARGLFALPEFVSLSERRDLDILDLRRVGRDLRILARPGGAG
ncbi:MAG: bifunctional diaminohydroxyphosphoribosylaminopyrimidine deaminase/5-amino-6-(5-phosphoribosylamino)uracil reductase RibD [Candidatus Nitricoxidivorans perseverans]|uniref:Riboflavin biosynthesis protein RibD n=1 Tax=Candidatus Nitricoxidivorans perseverans TaxID=2975601 RepID=A0AA49FMV3_9PROT|nr:MAG: bifunctional diaminohydroxyphosphoribosylaminopyrimidine deaminase/5-amino-6-(5-phosphoribosylamino)uracil reductase RibD [Candidatus Nitricoxidivorans perseverans]